MKLAGLGLIYKINNLYNENHIISQNGSDSQVVELSNLRIGICEIAFMTRKINISEIELKLNHNF